MALIHCPECGKEVSDKAAACIHCGYPLQGESKSEHTSNGFQVVLLSIGQNKIGAIKELRDIRPELGLADAVNLIESVPCLIAQNVPKDRAEFIKRGFQVVGANAQIQPAGSSIGELESKTFAVDDTQLICPKCKSTSVTTGQRGFSWITGFIGSQKTLNHCGSCGYSWQPKKK